MFSHLLATDAPDALQRFMRLLETSLADGSFARLVLSKPVGEDKTLQRLMLREVMLRGERQLSFLWRHQTRDITKNHPVPEAMGLLVGLLGAEFHNAHLVAGSQEVQLAFSRKGKPSLRVGKIAAAPAPEEQQGHDREKQRLLQIESPFWTDLALTHELKGQRQLVPAMARKWKQINRFTEIFSADFNN